MYQVKVFNRQTNEVIMESDTFQTMAEADAMLATVGSGEGYYSIVFKLDAVWSKAATNASRSLVTALRTRTEQQMSMRRVYPTSTARSRRSTDAAQDKASISMSRSPSIFESRS